MTCTQDEFFFRAFMEVPKQYKAIKKLLGYKPPPAIFGVPAAGGGGAAGQRGEGQPFGAVVVEQREEFKVGGPPGGAVLVR